MMEARMTTVDNDANSDPTDDAQKRERSTIEFPYMDLGDALKVAGAIHSKAGSSVCPYDALAATLELSPNSSGFRTRLSTARMFGLIESDRASGGVKLTALGQMTVDASRQREAKTKAFLSVPLYERLYEHYRGKVLPPTAGLEADISSLGVSSKQVDRARQAFERSAEIAGFFERGRNKLVAPVLVPTTPLTDEPSTESKSEPETSSDKTSILHPLITGLLQTLPIPGATWDGEERLKWLQMAASIFGVIYEGEAQIKMSLDRKSERA
jgi:hypothetical protein